VLAEFAVLEADKLPLPDDARLLFPADSDDPDAWTPAGTVQFSESLPEHVLVLLTPEAVRRLRNEGDLEFELDQLAEAVLLQARTLDPTITASSAVAIRELDGGELYARDTSSRSS
jgi:hypothetical protein